MIQSTCKTCRHWFGENLKGEDDMQLGQCRRYPPTLCMVVTTHLNEITNATQQQILPVARYPTVSEELWCGEHTVMIALLN